jgi:hypothetical protein
VRNALTNATPRVWIARAVTAALVITIGSVVVVSVKQSGLSPSSARGPVCATKSSAGAHLHAYAMPTPAGAGLLPEVGGTKLLLDTGSVTGDRPTAIHFRVVGPNGQPSTAVSQGGGVPMHVYLVRDDLGVYRHVHPTADARCGWSVSATLRGPAKYRVFVQFRTAQTSTTSADTVLSRVLTVTGGGAKPEPPPSPASAAAQAGDYRVDLTGYTVGSGESLLTATLSRGRRPVEDLAPYLGELAHVSVFDEKTLRFTHAHPVESAAGHHGPRLTLPMQLPGPGTYTMFLQFNSAGRVRTVPLRITAA